MLCIFLSIRKLRKQIRSTHTCRHTHATSRYLEELEHEHPQKQIWQRVNTCFFPSRNSFAGKGNVLFLFLTCTQKSVLTLCQICFCVCSCSNSSKSWKVGKVACVSGCTHAHANLFSYFPYGEKSAQKSLSLSSYCFHAIHPTFHKVGIF